MKTLVRYIFLLVCVPTSTWAWESETEILLKAYLHYSLAQEVRAQALQLAQELPASKGAEVEELMEEWFGMQLEDVRDTLDRQFAADARDRFQTFVVRFTAAENEGDLEYLEHLAGHTVLRGLPRDYPHLRRLAIDRWLGGPLNEGTRLLTEIQTWTEVSARRADTPSLAAWIDRDAYEVSPASPAVASPPPRPTRPVNPLAAAEAPPPAWEERVPPPGSALDSYAQRRRDKREQALQSAQSGMQQMAMERQSAEMEFAARKMADAQADADAMRAQAQRLAAAESEAMAQRENSWGNRIKRIVGGTVSAGVGAFTGGIGAEAGRRAADELFR